MNRLGFIQRLMAVAGVGGSLGLHSRHSDVPDLPAPARPYHTPAWWLERIQPERMLPVFRDA